MIFVVVVVVVVVVVYMVQCREGIGVRQ